MIKFRLEKKKVSGTPILEFQVLEQSKDIKNYLPFDFGNGLCSIKSIRFPCLYDHSNKHKIVVCVRGDKKEMDTNLSYLNFKDDESLDYAHRTILSAFNSLSDKWKSKD